MLENIKLLLGITDNDKDELIMLLLERCQDELIQYTHNEDLCDCDSLIASMVIYNYNLLGTEGVNSENYSGVTFNYSTDYPEHIIRQMKANRKLRIC